MMLAMASARAASVPTLIGTHSDALAPAWLAKGSTTTIFMPLIRASAAFFMLELDTCPAACPLEAPKKTE